MKASIRKIASIILFPLTMWYAIIVFLRNLMYKDSILKRTIHRIPVISVGNLSTGGTGKTPHVEYLINLLSNNKKVAVLSRGYGRKTKGFLLAYETSSAKTIGDEPFQYYQKFKNITVAVSENRNLGVEKLLKSQNPPEIVILDDAFQHKAIKPQINILLTEFSHPFYKDYILPFGNLREFRCSSKQADIIIITKCPDNMKDEERQKIIKKLKLSNIQNVFFSYIRYGQPVSLNGHSFELYEDVLVFTGIANPKPLYEYLGKHYKFNKIAFPDHHSFTQKDILNIKEEFSNIPSKHKALFTTEKDASRLKNLPEFELLKDIPLFYIPIEVDFHHSHSTFDQTILDRLNFC